MTQLPYGHQTIDDSDVAAVVRVLGGDWLTQGPTIDEFEAALSTKVGARHAVAFNSGTAALHAACAAAGLGVGDEVLTTPLSFAASANCARYVGAMPRFVDIDGRLLVTSAASLAEAADASTRAVIPVHYAGRPIDLTDLGALRENGVWVIEDAAHALGAVGENGLVGSCGASDMTCFSFHPVKAITTGEGGAVTTNDDGLAERLRAFRTHGIVKVRNEEMGGWYYEIAELGMNYRITDLQCALGLAQLPRMSAFIARRNEIAQRYRELLADTPIELPPPVRSGDLHAYHLVVGLLPEGADRRRVYDAMRSEGIGVQVHYIPIYWHPYYHRLGFERGLCPEAERAYERCLSLPVYPNLSDADVTRVVETLVSALEAAQVPA